VSNSKKHINISTVVKESWCTGCGTCVAFCPEKALEIEYTTDGRYVPTIIESKCTNCGLCVDLCPAANENFKQLNQFIFDKIPENKLLGNYINCFSGYSADETLRWKATSGGIATSLILFALREGSIDGAVLTRITKEDPLKAEPFLARTADEIYSAMGSKYVPVPLNLMSDFILTQKGKFAIVALPCHMWGLRRAQLKFPKLMDKIAYLIGLMCSHTISFRGVQFVLKKIGVSPGDVDRLQFRGDGWPGGLKIILRDKTERFVTNFGSWWSEIFGGYFFSHYYCTLCPDHFNEFADIVLGDAWLHHIVKNDKIGTSVVITRTNRGQELIKRAKAAKIIRLLPLDLKAVIASQFAPALFKKRNITARMKLLSAVHTKIPKNLKDNENYFLAPTLVDYPAAVMLYTSRFISRNSILKKLLQNVPFCVLRFWRIIFKQSIVHRKKTIIGANRDMGNNRINIVVTNSHSDNRGDEAAQKAMITTLRKLIPQAKFTVITRSPSGLDLQEEVDILRFVAYSRKFPFASTPFVVLWLVFKLLGIELSSLFGKSKVFKTLKCIADADIVISAPGGPYLGDIYKTHEISEHLLQLFIAKLFKKPVIIYGPSMGPFRIRWRNILRKHLLNKVEIIALRDPISRKYLSVLKLTKPIICVTADSAFQDEIQVDKSMLRKIMLSEGIIETINQDFTSKALIGLTPAAARWNFPNSQNPERDQDKYNKIIAKAVDYMIEKFNAQIVFYPQLYGRNSDIPLIEAIIGHVKSKQAVTVLSNKWNSEIQQALISKMDMVVGNRYHSVVFSLKSKVPTMCIAYEHKSVGIMKAAGLENCCIEVKDLDYEKLIEKIEYVWSKRKTIRDLLTPKAEFLRKMSLANSILVKALTNCACDSNIEKNRLLREVEKLTTQYGLDSLKLFEAEQN